VLRLGFLIGTVVMIRKLRRLPDRSDADRLIRRMTV
jgi:hypothetical protein